MVAEGDERGARKKCFGPLEEDSKFWYSKHLRRLQYQNFVFFNGAAETVVKFFKIYTDSEVSLLIFFFWYFSRSSSRISFLIFSRSYFSAAGSDCFFPCFETKSVRTDSFGTKYFSNSRKMILNSASETPLSTRAFETSSLTVSRFAVASAKIFSCFKI